MYLAQRPILQRIAGGRVAASGVRALNIPVGEPTVLPTEPEAIKRTPTPPPPEEQLPGGAEVEDLKHVGTDSGKGFLQGAIKAGAASDVVTGEASKRVEGMERERREQEGGAEAEPGVAERAGSAVAEGARRVKEAVESAYNKVADQFGSRR